MTVTLSDIYNLGEYVFVGGSTQTFIFYVTQDGAPIDISGSTCSVKICPLGQKDVVTATLSGTITDAVGGVFNVIWSGNNTTSLTGKFEMQPICVDIDGIPHIDGTALLTIVGKIGG